MTAVPSNEDLIKQGRAMLKGAKENKRALTEGEQSLQDKWNSEEQPFQRQEK
jgi:hypothetical protein